MHDASDSNAPGHSSQPVPCSSVAIKDLGECRILGLLGRGEIGSVWLAQSEGSGERTAIKFLEADVSSVHRSWFVREQEALAALDHPSVPRFYEAGALEDGRLWFAMEYIDGRSLSEYSCRADLSLEDRYGLFRKVLEAVRHVHGRRIIHRDLNSSNILVDRGGDPHLLDFGLARRWEGAADDGMLADLAALAELWCEMAGERPANPSADRSEGQVHSDAVSSAKSAASGWSEVSTRQHGPNSV